MPRGKPDAKKSKIDFEKILGQIEQRLRDDGDYSIAKAMLDGLINKNPVALLSRAFVLRAKIHEKLRSFPEAEEDYKQAIKNNHEHNLEILFDFGCFLISVARTLVFKNQSDEKYKQAAEQFCSYLSKQSNPKVQCMLGVATAAVGNYENAVGLITAALNQAKNQNSTSGLSAFGQAMQAYCIAKKDKKEITLKGYNDILNDLNLAIATEPHNEQYKQQKKIIEEERELLIKKRVVSVDDEVPAAVAKKSRKEEEKNEVKNPHNAVSKPQAFTLRFSFTPTSTLSPELDAALVPPSTVGIKSPPPSPVKLAGSPNKSTSPSRPMMFGFHVTVFKSKAAAARLSEEIASSSVSQSLKPVVNAESPVLLSQEVGTAYQIPDKTPYQVETPVSQILRADAICKNKLV